jgi:hypothetical protein
MAEVLNAGLLLLILLDSRGLGLFIMPLLSEQHRSAALRQIASSRISGE